MPSLIPAYEYDIFVSYRRNDNAYDGWVTEFVVNLRRELEATVKRKVSIYFEENPVDGLLETDNVDESLSSKIKTLIFIPIISQTYCDPESFAWRNEFLVFNKMTANDRFGPTVKLFNGNVSNRVLPVKIHDIDAEDVKMLERELKTVLRPIAFIYKSPGVNRPLRPKDDDLRINANQVVYRDQINKVANAVKEIIGGLKNFGSEFKESSKEIDQPRLDQMENMSPAHRFWLEFKRRKVFRVATVYGIAGWVIIQIADVVFMPLHLPAWALTLLIVLILLGFPVALILAWAFEMSPDETVKSNVIKTEGMEPASSGEKKLISKFSLALLIIGLTGAIIYFQFYGGSAAGLASLPVAVTSGGEKSIAVLPFENLTNDQELETFCDGVTEEILNHLSKVGSLNVTSRTSVKMYKGTKLSVIEIGKNLGVTHILEGSVRKSGEKVRITAQLIDATTDKHIWSEDYDYHELKDIFPVQTDVSTRVMEVLKVKLTRQEKESLSKTYTDNIQAYKLYLKGRFFWDKRTRETYDSAEVCYKRALVLDPEYALAYSGLADCYTFNLTGLPQPEAVPIAEAYARKALSLDSTLCEAWTTIGFIQSHFNYQWSEGKRTLEKAINCDPNYPIAHLYYGNIFIAAGDLKRGIEEAKKALALDPLSFSINSTLGRNYYESHQYDLSIKQLQKTLALERNYQMAQVYLGLSFLQKGHYPEAINIFSEMPSGYRPPEERSLLLNYAYAIAGDKTKARIELEKALRDKPKLNPFSLATVYVSLGNFNEALNQLERGYEVRVIQMINVKVDPRLDPIRNEPRFKALLKKMNLD